MRLSPLIWQEALRRKARLAIGLAAVALAVASFACVTATSESWERAIESHLHSIGPNAFLVPRQMPASAIHRARFGPPQMPDYTLTKLRRAGILKRGLAVPALLYTIRLQDQKVVLRGWSEQSRLPGAVPVAPFAPDEVVLGAAAAERLALRPGDPLVIRDHRFRVAAVRPKLGTAADLEVLCEMQELRRLIGAEQKLTMLEVIVTEQSERDRLARQLPALLPDVRLITRRDIVKTQLATLAAARKVAFLLVGLIAVTAGLGISLQTLINVRERRREVGTLMAIGASARQVLGLFVQKAVLVGLVGSAAGYLAGMVVAVLFGPHLTGEAVRPSLALFAGSLATGVLLSSLAAGVPALSAARLDPVDTLSEA